ncbi:C13 family peptidase [Noviherbaspirillum cavernae]|nr:C13 family peptidase [Noviherbaspirillum cavernae]
MTNHPDDSSTAGPAHEVWQTPQQTQQQTPSLLRCLIEGGRCALLMPPRWQSTSATPWTIALLTALGLVQALVLQRLYIVGPATFYWQAIAGGWSASALLAWGCYAMRPQPHADSGADAAPGAAHLFTMLLALTLVISTACGFAYVVLIRNGLYTETVLGAWGMWALWLGPAVWLVLAQLILLLRSGDRKPAAMLAGALAIALATTLFFAVQQPEFWYPEEKNAASAAKRLRLTQELMESRQQLLTQRLDGIKPQRPGIVDLYGIGFSPYAEEDVFRRETAMVAAVMAQRFDADGRIMQLVNHAETVAQWPWATPLNLQRTIKRMAAIMDPKEDILFMHLTSHGARDGQLAARFWPMDVAALQPAELKAWLDEAGIKYRVISISACYSGSWIAPLADDNTLVVTAADAEHTSYGCGRSSELTYFGRAMYDEQLRTQTLSFNEAHQAARQIIKQREEEAGKDDGYSNPQIREGAGIQDRLALLRKRLQ